MLDSVRITQVESREGRKLGILKFAYFMGFFTMIAQAAAPIANANFVSHQVPVVNKFEVSSPVIDLASPSPTVNFTLEVSHPIGLISNSTLLRLESLDKFTTFSTYLVRQTQKSSNNKFIFSGKFTFPFETPAGLYNFFAESIEGLPGSLSTTAPSTGRIFPNSKINNFPESEFAIQVRSQGQLKLNRPTFVGPSYTAQRKISDGKSVIYETDSPIFRVGEVYDANKYFVKRVEKIKINVQSFSPSVCSANEFKLVFLVEGLCNFRVFSEASDDYLSTSVEFSEEIKSSRTKQILAVESIPTQSAVDLPKRIPRSTILSLDGSVVVPISKTPTICFGTFDSITIISGGICTLQYQSVDTKDFLASEVFVLEFEIKKRSQTLQLSLPSELDLTTKPLQLKATSTSGGNVEIDSKSPGICRVSQGFLRVLGLGNCNLVATQSGSYVFDAVSTEFSILITEAVLEKNEKKCFKKNKSRIFSNAKCPKGWTPN